MSRRFRLPIAAAPVLLLLMAGAGDRGVAAPDDNGKPAEKALRFDVTVTTGDTANGKKEVGELLKVKRGETIFIHITGTPGPGYHTYPVTIPAGEVKSETSRLTWPTVKGVDRVGEATQTPPAKVNTANGPVLGYDKPFTWKQQIRVGDEAAPGVVEIPVKIETNVCNDEICIHFKSEFRPKVEVKGPPTTPEKESPAEPQGINPVKKFSEPLSGLISVSSEEYQARMEALGQQIVQLAPEPDAGLLAFMLAGMFWGGVSLITPCVFPMIPITVSFFLKQSEKEHHRPIVMASVYSLTIVVVLTLAAAFLLQMFRLLSINPLMNYGLGALFIFFALSLFGMYEIELPSGLARFTSAREGRGGIVGTIFMALTFTIISFACVAPFLGGFGGTAAAARPMWHNLLGGFAFAATFAAPFFFLALFPTLLKALPKSGSWLNSVKVVMGFLELAAAFKFFRGAELIQSGSEVTFFTYDLVLCVWIALAFLCGLYLIGVFRLPHDTPAESIGVPRLLFSAAFIGISLYLTPALFKVNKAGDVQRPGGVVYAWVDAFLLPESRGGGGGSKDHPIIADLHFAIEKSREYLRVTGQPKRVLVDFTGVVCSNCRINEQNVFPRPEVREALQQYLYVELYADRMPVELYTPEVRAQIAKDKDRLASDRDTNEAFELKVVDEITLPTYVILEPRLDGKILVVDIYKNGRISDVPDFMKFLTGARAKEKRKLAQE